MHPLWGAYTAVDCALLQTASQIRCGDAHAWRMTHSASIAPFMHACGLSSPAAELL